VFHSNPQVQNRLTSLRGDQPQRRQRTRGGSEVVGFFFFFKLWNNDRIVGDRTHDGYYDLRPKARGQT
jgi:hypothetical protein